MPTLSAVRASFKATLLPAWFPHLSVLEANSSPFTISSNPSAARYERSPRCH
jgi:hypothetical protein